MTDANLLCRLPNFFIIGAPKAGTTSLYKYLSEHPGVYFPEKKEIEHFLSDELYQRGLDYLVQTHYQAAAGFPARGDGSVQYLLSETAAVRIKESLPPSHHRFIVVLRNPIDRAYSAYWWEVREGSRPRPFLDVIRDEPQRLAELRARGHRWWKYAHLQHGLYAENLERWFQHFPKSCFKVLFFEEFSDIKRLMAEVLSFLELDPASGINTSVRHNQAALPRWALLQRLVARDSRFKSFAKRVLPPRWVVKAGILIREINRVDFRYPPLDGEAREYLARFYQHDIERLSSMTNRDLSRWVDG